MSTTIAAVATQVLEAAAAVTETVLAEEPNVYLDKSSENLSIINAAILLVSVTVAIILRFNRMIAVPIIATLAGTIDNSMDWYAHASPYALINRRVALVFADIGWSVQEAVLTLYSFFLLEKILRDKQRWCFISSFMLFFTAIVGIRVTLLVLHNMALTDDSLIPLIERIMRAYFATLAVLECISAAFLLTTFYAASAQSDFVGAANSGLFARLAHSSEIRVAMLAGIGITRAVCFGNPDTVPTAIDNTAYTLQNAFPVVLLVDLLLTRNAKLQATVDNGSGGGTSCSCHLNPSAKVTEKTVGSARSRPWSNTLGSASGKGAVDTLEPDYEVYVGKGFGMDDNNTSRSRVGTGISEIKEEAEEV